MIMRAVYYHVGNPYVLDCGPREMCTYERRLHSNLFSQLIDPVPNESTDYTPLGLLLTVADVDRDLATISYRVSLVCPLGKIRMKIPAMSIHCDHLQCFDARTFILMNEKKQTWICQTFVSSTTLNKWNKNIEFSADGTWRAFEETKTPIVVLINPEISRTQQLNPNIDDNITITWTRDRKYYVFAVFIVKKNNADVDRDLATISYRVSLVCPLGKIRMKIPAMSIHCDHLQCFDARTFILMNEKKQTWICQTSDGTWRAFEETKNTNSILDKLKHIDYVDLDCDDEECIE
ncbi:hypothetical protein AGLY_017747 [Aphis glycines]|uniref:SP-RING-type domain-containing protein n=1 Tax=Aphis glycines TaxID=307491 RepID=A0A6G0SUT7_APHGL|nr:hypothetical protein AGLY_017747 [Aphis glycines]